MTAGEVITALIAGSAIVTAIEVFILMICCQIASIDDKIFAKIGFMFGAIMLIINLIVGIIIVFNIVL